MKNKFIIIFSLMLLLVSSLASASLVHHWNFDNNLDDQVGNKNLYVTPNTTDTGRWDFSSDISSIFDNGTSFQFKAYTGVVLQNDTPYLDVEQSFTISTVVKSNNGWPKVLIDSGNATQGFILSSNDNGVAGLQARLKNSKGWKSISSSGLSLSTTSFHHVVMAYNYTSDKITLYLDNTSNYYDINTATSTSFSNSLNFNKGGLNRYLFLDDYKIYDNILTTSQLETLFSTGDITPTPTNYSVDITSPNSSSVYTLNSTGVNISFEWETSETLNYNVGIGKLINNIPVVSNITDKFYNKTFYTSDGLNGSYYIFINASDETNSSVTQSNYTFNICTSNWVSSTSECVDNEQNITYSDANNCLIEYDKPSDYTQECGITPSTDDTDWFTIILFVFIFVVVLIFGFLTHPLFFGFNGFLLIMFALFSLPSLVTNAFITAMFLVFGSMLVLLSILLTINKE